MYNFYIIETTFYSEYQVLGFRNFSKQLNISDNLLQMNKKPALLAESIVAILVKLQHHVFLNSLMHLQAAFSSVQLWW